MARIFEDMPDRIKALPRNDKGFPIPYFAEEINGQRDFRVVSQVQMMHAVRHEKCWVCGQRLGVYKAFVIGPMCGINRTISDPPSHRDCAIFSARNCPFLSRPLAKRRSDDLPAQAREAPGIALMRNPGATGVWVTTKFRPFRPGVGSDGYLFELGDPTEVLWFANGRDATREEVQHSIDTGLPALMKLAAVDGPDGVAELERRIEHFRPLLPASEVAV